MEEIRLIRLMPGNLDEAIAFSIIHTPLVLPKCGPSKRLSIGELRKTLPDDWFVGETMEGDYLFMAKGTSSPNSWDHPDPSIDPDTYKLNKTNDVFEHEPRYEALSYTWGQNSESVIAYILDSSDSTQSPYTMQIGQNLDSALRNLRYADQSRMLWVDAICINQNDVDERNAQVKRMGNIYSLAYKVVAWLGEETVDSKHALATLEYFGQQVELTVDNLIGDAPGAKEPQWWMSEYLLPYDVKTWKSLISLFHRDWFSRVWVLQEVELARRSIIQCGADSCPWPAIRKSIRSLSKRRGAPPELTNVVSSYKTGLVSKYDEDLATLLDWSRTRECTDPRDRVYGLLSLTPSSFSERIRPEYSLPIEKTYVDTFLTHLSVTGRLDLLAQCRIERKLENGASWVPNWNRRAGSFLGGYRAGWYLRQASGDSAACARYLDSDTLQVYGVQCACVGSVSEIISNDVTEQVKQALREFGHEPFHIGSYVSGCSMLEACLEVVFQGQMAERLRERRALRFPSIHELQKSYLWAIFGGSKETIDFSHMATLKTDKALIFTTREGYLGAGSPGVQPDDRICILLGCDVPMILRPTMSNRYLVVGPCFVHGLMDGEGLLGPVPPPWKFQMAFPDDRWIPQFYNTMTEELWTKDPRLPPLPAEWEELSATSRTQSAGQISGAFINRRTGEILNTDPRLLPDALKSRGVGVEQFYLV